MSVKVSIIIPIYNVANYLSKCLNSVCNQTLKDIEIIAVNDKSPDSCAEILNNFKKKDNRLIINNETNKGTAYSRNAGLNLAQGEYVSFVDGDDYLDLDFCEKLYLLAKKNNADIAKAATKTVNQDYEPLYSIDNKIIKEKGKFFFWAYLWSAIYKRDMLKRNNVFFYIDFFCFQIQAVYFANKISCCDNTFYNYVRHSGSCDSEIFSLEKWQRLNIGHANFVYDWVLTHDYDEDIKQFYLDMVREFYFYGFNKLEKSDIIEACKILSQIITEKYNCGFNIENKKKLCRKLYRINKKTSWYDYLINIIKFKI